MSARILKGLTLLAATVLAGCAYAPYHSGGAVRDYDYGYAGSGYSDSYYDDFYYYPRVGIYFNIHSGYYYYQHEHRWIRTRTLPRHYRLHPDHRVRMKAHRSQPYRDYKHHSQRYRSDRDHWRHHDRRDDSRGDRDRDRDRYDRSDRHDRHSSVETRSSPRRYGRNLQDGGRRQEHTVDRPSRNPGRIERAEDNRRRAADVGRSKEKHQTRHQDSLRRQEVRHRQENRQPDGRARRDAGRIEHRDAQRHDARQQERQTKRAERRETMQAERRVERRAERRAERRQAVRDQARPDADRARRGAGRADRQKPGPVQRRSKGEVDSDPGLRWLRHNSRDN